MSGHRLERGVSALCILAVVGCASTRVKKDPGPDDCGIRYYRAKPYLLIQSNAAAGTPALASTQTYTLSLQALPDYSEEFSLHITPGLGINNTEVSFDSNGYGTLTGLNVNVNSNAAEMISAITGLISAQPNLFRSPPSENLAENGRGTWATCVVRGHNVPVGYYEAVLNVGPDGKKRLFGWRYLGFAPFAACPVESFGGGVMTCNESDLYGLVTVGDCMTFRKLRDLCTDDMTPCPVRQQPSGDGKKVGAEILPTGFAAGR